MFHGFYNLASGIVTQNRNLDVISNNMVNMSTTGYKAEKFTSTTFQEELLYRTGNHDKSNNVPLGTTSMIKTSGGVVTSFEQGNHQVTGEYLDFALTKPGFFVIQTDQGNIYTRNGSFALDPDGYLSLPGSGRVMGENGPLQFETGQITVDGQGNLYEVADPSVQRDDDDTAPQEVEMRLVGKIQVVDFDDYNQLEKINNQSFTTNAQGTIVDGGIEKGMLEGSNVDAVTEMTAMMSSQRAIQSATQMMRMYDTLMSKIVTDIGKI